MCRWSVRGCLLIHSKVPSITEKEPISTPERFHLYYAYIIENTLNNKIYVGITKDPHERWMRHKSRARNISSKNKFKSYIHNAMFSHGIENFTFTVIKKFQNKKDCEQYEINKIKYYKNRNIKTYNLHSGGTLGFDMSKDPRFKEWKIKLSKSAIANSTDKMANKQWRDKLKKARKGRTPALGMKHTVHAKKIAAEASSKYWDTQDTFSRNPEKIKKILLLSHREAKIEFGISTTHYYRLKKRFS